MTDYIWPDEVIETVASKTGLGKMNVVECLDAAMDAMIASGRAKSAHGYEYLMGKEWSASSGYKEPRDFAALILRLAAQEE